MKIIIPSRYASTRLPGKPLADICGKPMIWHVWQRGIEVVGIENCWVATDHDDIFNVMSEFGAQVIMTHAEHASGTDRIAEVVTKLGWEDEEIVVNVQGDEPLMPPHLVTQVGQLLQRCPDAGISTLAHSIERWEDLVNPNIVKVVVAESGLAHYFSRSPIPYDRDGSQDITRYPYLRHIGIYAYRVGAIKALQSLQPAPSEVLESLEQLRALWHGIPITVATVADVPPHGVDTQEDLDAVRESIGCDYV